MAITIYNEVQANNWGAGTSFTFTVPAPVDGRSLVIKFTGVSIDLGITSIVHAGAAWSKNAGINVNRTAEIWRAHGVSGAGTNITVNLAGTPTSANGLNGVYFELDPLEDDVAGVIASGNSTTPTSGSITPTATREVILFAACRPGGNVSAGPNGGFTAITPGDIEAAFPRDYGARKYIASAAGAHAVDWVASSGNWVVALSSFRVPAGGGGGNTAPNVSITSPTNFAQSRETVGLTFSCTATDAQDGTLSGGSLVWNSSIDGNFATGANTGVVNTLSPGVHDITVTGTDSGGLTDSDTITVSISAVRAIPFTPYVYGGSLSQYCQIHLPWNYNPAVPCRLHIYEGGSATKSGTGNNDNDNVGTVNETGGLAGRVFANPKAAIHANVIYLFMQVPNPTPPHPGYSSYAMVRPARDLVKAEWPNLDLNKVHASGFSQGGLYLNEGLLVNADIFASVMFGVTSAFDNNCSAMDPTIGSHAEAQQKVAEAAGQLPVRIHWSTTDEQIPLELQTGMIDAYEAIPNLNLDLHDHTPSDHGSIINHMFNDVTSLPWLYSFDRPEPVVPEEPTRWSPDELTTPPVLWFSAKELFATRVLWNGSDQVTFWGNRGSVGAVSDAISPIPANGPTLTKRSVLQGYPAITSQGAAEKLVMAGASFMDVLVGVNGGDTTVRFKIGAADTTVVALPSHETHEILAVSWTVAGFKIYSNGVLVNTTAVVLPNAGYVAFVLQERDGAAANGVILDGNTIFNLAAGGSPFNGDIGEWLRLNYEPTQADREHIEGYLADEWGLSHLLNVAHPYRYIATTVLPPEEFYFPRLPSDFTGTKRIVTSEAQFWSAIGLAQDGDVIAIPQGLFFQGQVSLRNRGTSGWVEIRTDISDAALDAICPQNTRMTEERAAALNLGGFFGNQTNGAILCDDGAGGWRITALYVGGAADVDCNTPIRFMPTTNNPGSMPERLVADRLCMLGSTTRNHRRAIGLTCNYGQVTDCQAKHYADANSDSQGAAIFGGGGPYLIRNTELQGWSECFICGGSESGYPANELDGVPHSLVFEHNLLTRDISLRGTGYPHANEKNGLEFKSLRRGRVRYNVIENTFQEAQVGFGVLVKSDNGQTNDRYLAGTRDVEVSHNLIRNVSCAIQITPNPDNVALVRVHHIWVHNNLFENVAQPPFHNPETAPSVAVEGDIAHVLVEHNTVANNHPIYSSYGLFVTTDLAAIGPVTIRNNILAHGQYGLKGSNFNEGEPSWTPATGAYGVFQKNAVVGMASIGAYPATTIPVVNDAAVGYVDPASGDWRLAVSSPLHNAGTDGFDIGVLDLQLIRAKAAQTLAGVVDPLAPSDQIPDHLQVATQPGNGVTGVALATQPVVRITDVFGTPIGADNASVITAQLVAVSGIGTAIGTLTKVVTAGSAAFVGLGVNSVLGGTFKWRFTTPGLTLLDSNSFTVTGEAIPEPPVISGMSMVEQPSASVNSGAAFVQAPIVRIVDQYGATFDTSILVTALIVNGNGVITAGSTVAAVNGFANFADIRVVGSGFVALGFSVPGVPGVASSQFDVVGAAPTSSVRRRNFRRRRGGR